MGDNSSPLLLIFYSKCSCLLNTYFDASTNHCTLQLQIFSVSVPAIVFSCYRVFLLSCFLAIVFSCYRVFLLLCFLAIVISFPLLLAATFTALSFSQFAHCIFLAALQLLCSYGGFSECWFTMRCLHIIVTL